MKSVGLGVIWHHINRSIQDHLEWINENIKEKKQK